MYIHIQVYAYTITVLLVHVAPLHDVLQYYIYTIRGFTILRGNWGRGTTTPTSQYHATVITSSAAIAGKLYRFKYEITPLNEFVGYIVYTKVSHRPKHVSYGLLNIFTAAVWCGDSLKARGCWNEGGSGSQVGIMLIFSSSFDQHPNRLGVWVRAAEICPIRRVTR